MSDTGRQDQAGWFRWWYWPLGAVILALTIVPFIRISYQKRVERLEASLRADGIPVTARELAEAYPDPPREENAATVYRSAYTHFKPWPGEDKAPAG
jgi:hypothetical protein